MNSSGTSVDSATTPTGYTALHLACSQGHIGVVGLLLSRSTALLKVKSYLNKLEMNFKANKQELDLSLIFTWPKIFRLLILLEEHVSMFQPEVAIMRWFKFSWAKVLNLMPKTMLDGYPYIMQPNQDIWTQSNFWLIMGLLQQLKHLRVTFPYGNQSLLLQ